MKQGVKAGRSLARLAAASALLFLCAAGARAWQPLAYPFSNWGEFLSDFNKVQGGVTQGWVQQGVDWVKLPGGAVFDTFGGYYWMARSDNQTYYNQNGPYAGAMISRGAFSVGGQYYWETFPALRQYVRDPQVFGSWYKVMNLGLPSWLSGKALAAPLSTWGRVQYDANSIEGLGTMGWFQQGLDWFKLPGGVVFDTYGALRWMERSRNERYYDELGPALGVQFSRGSINLDVEYDWERYPDIPQSVDGPQVFLTWYFNCDLAALGRTRP
ncbi:MAG TPA: hypothetical protein VNH15_04465 [Elusimicrobiota bacterium]|nr:hypothetical protein [Elusimicrobiota bacterium]